MASILVVIFLETGKVWKYYTADDDRYVLPNGSLEWVHTDIVWCSGCQKITQAELVEPLAELDATLEEINLAADPTTPEGRKYKKAVPKKKDRESQIEYYRDFLLTRRRWLAARVSPAKCLTCGTTDLISLRNSEGVQTPIGKLTLRKTMGGASMISRARYFSPEGDRMEHTPPPRKAEVPKRKWWQFWLP